MRRFLLFFSLIALLFATSAHAEAEDFCGFPKAEVGVPYSFDFFGDTIDTSGEFSLVFFPSDPSQLPPGLTMSGFGRMSGIPTAAGTFNFIINFAISYPDLGPEFFFNIPLPCSMQVSGITGPPLRISPDVVQVSILAGRPSWSQPITLSNLGSTPIPFTASVLPGASWLGLSAASGSVPGFGETSLVATVASATLAPGTYAATIRIQAPSINLSTDLPVVVTVSSGGQSIGVSQSGLFYRSLSGGAAPPTQTVQVYAAGPNPLNFSVATSTQNGGSWLSVTPNGATATPGGAVPVTITANSAGLAPGDYYGSVRISAPNVANSPQIITVVLNVAQPNTVLEPALSTYGLIFVGTAGVAPPAPATVRLSTPASAPVEFGASQNFPNDTVWFDTRTSGPTVSASAPATITVTPRTTGLAPGVYRGAMQVRFTDLDIVRTVSTVMILLPPASALSEPIRSATGCTPTRLLPVFTLIGAGFSGAAGWPLSIGATVVDDCGTPMTGGSVTASFSNGDAPIALGSSGDGNWAATWQPQNLRDQVAITLRAQQTTPALSGSETIGGEVAGTANVPIVTSGGVVSAASFVLRQPLAPGSFVSIFGKKLANGLTVSPSAPYGTKLGDTQVLLGGRELPLQFIAEGQVNAIIPYDVPPNSTQQLIVVNGGAVSTPEPVVIAPAQPALFSSSQNGKGNGVIVGIQPNRDPFLVNPANPVSAGDILVIYAAGLGAVSNPVPAGAPATGISRTENPVTVTIGDKPAEVQFSGLAPGFPGVYQLNVVVPSGIPANNEVPVIVTTAGQSSTPVTIAIR